MSETQEDVMFNCRSLVWLGIGFLLIPASLHAQSSIRCESNDGRYHECRWNGVGSVSVERQLSDSECIEGRSWGTRRDVIWVDRGCRADFLISNRIRRDDAWRNTASVVTCESRDGRRNVCSADTRGGVTLARQLSDSACVQGRSWGFDRNSIWVDDGCRAEFRVSAGAYPAPLDVVTCESRDGRRNACPADTAGGVTLGRQLSDTACVQGRTWGFDRNSIWVDDGCRAEFRVGRPIYSPGATTVSCESRDGRRNVCRADTAGGVTIARPISDTACVQGRNWGYDRTSIWVDDGCRAEFRIAGLISTPPSYGNARTVVCESSNGRRTRCAADTRYGVTLVRRLSDSACIQGRSWGYDRTGIWVDEGCRAEFSVVTR